MTDVTGKIADQPAGAGSAETPLVVLALAIVYFVWGGTFLAIRYAVAEIPPLALIALRCGLGALVLIAYLAIRNQWVWPTVSEIRTAFVAGTFMFLGCHGVLAWAEQRVPSGQAALAFVSLPIWLVLLVAARDRRPPGKRVVLGLLLGAAGVAELAAVKGIGGTRPIDWVILTLSDLSWAVGSLWATGRGPVTSPVRATSLQLAAGAVVLAVASVAFGEPARWEIATVSPRAWTALTFLVVGGTALGLTAYTWLLSVTTPALAGSYAFVNPVVALGLAWLTGDEPFRATTLLGAGLVIGGVALVREAPKPRSSDDQSEARR